MLALAIGVVTTISVGFKKSLLSIWQVFARDISAPGVLATARLILAFVFAINS